MARTDFARMNCSIARAIDILGQPWTPLVLRDLLLGLNRFDEIQRDLGIATNVLADRLEWLTGHGVVERRPYGAHPNRFEYHLTEKGRDAVPILLALIAWGDRWEEGGAGAPTEIVHTRCGKVTHAVVHCGECGKPLDVDDIEYRNGPAGETIPGTLLLREWLDHRGKPA